MSIMRNQPQINIKAIFAKKRRGIALRIEAAAARGQVYLESGGTEAIADFVDHVMETIREGAYELLRSVPVEALHNQQWFETLDRCTDFVDTQCEYLFTKCLELWGSDAQLAQAYIDDRCYRLKTELGSEVEITHRLKRKSPWEIKTRETIKISREETVKLLIISVVALTLGFILGKLL